MNVEPDSKKRKDSSWFGSKRVKDSVSTPPELYDALHLQYNFDFDPCPLNEEWVIDGLKVDWGKRNYVNPPYSRGNIQNWIQKAIAEAEKGNLSVMLIPGRTCSNYWQELIFPNLTNITFLNYVKFPGYKNHIPLAMVILEFDPEKKKIFELTELSTLNHGWKIRSHV